MRTIERSSTFKRDYKHTKANPQHRSDLDALVMKVLAALVADQTLPASNRDHALSGQWTGNRECHIKPDLLLVYRKLDHNILRLVRLGSHSELFS
ncbi:type II toxin-antitoxin system mRNA interferase toxin, RelE/StbE family [Chromatium okenii]|uniref:type II toxin-antitoxin system YafQ family toxin n=1 Tax=Chromatium okenii TaxID=61644 RepID=UPI0019041137|nr:type II toxin-antitoxin system YafQ family toxin [Chromatium okenii]MBK1642980.1 type II toxin-antitoxin system mRNA interferase toxin, RelE/StbE family [Chromatium okenii]